MSGVRFKVVEKKDNSAKVIKTYNQQIQQIINKGLQDTRNTAVLSIHSTTGGGKTYEKYNPRRTHTASAPLDPPNTDTGYLANNIFAILDADGLGGQVESRADYSEALEFGTSTMTERPFLQPALEENRPKIRAMFARLKARGVK